MGKLTILKLIMTVGSFFLLAFLVAFKLPSTGVYLAKTCTDSSAIKVDSFQLWLNEYSRLDQLIQNDSVKVKNSRKRTNTLLKQARTELQKELSLDSLRKVKNKQSNSKVPDSLKVKNNYARIEAVCDSSIRVNKRKLIQIDSSIDGENKLVQLLGKTITANTNALLVLIQKIKKYTSTIKGSKSIRFGNVQYHLYVADLAVVDIRTHLFYPASKKNYHTIEHVKSFLESQKINPLMITNAGMYTPTNEPEGLYVEEGSEVRYELDTAGAQDVNFYMKPNGVFLIDTNNVAYIYTTEEYQQLTKAKKLKTRMATQSGPMLVIKDKIHPVFVKNSLNEKIRSGVGVMAGNKVVFAITLNESNFYRFSVFFKDVFGCKNALFLDGAISQMYLHDIAPTVLGGDFGPVLSVSPKIIKK